MKGSSETDGPFDEDANTKNIEKPQQHGETKKGEVFAGNMLPASLDSEFPKRKYPSVRLGEVAYDILGLPVLNKTRPVFLSAEDYNKYKDSKRRREREENRRKEREKNVE